MTTKEIKTDKRKLNSRKKIKEAFISLHAREGYDAVTVSGVCNEAGISRGTFYAHYKNVIEVPQNLVGMITTPKMNFFNDGNIYAFSDTLIQYLLLGVICGVDPINENIIRVQEYISSNEFRKANGSVYTKPYRRGVWDDNIQDFILNTILNTRYLITKLDKNGLVDRETEEIITRGQVI